MYLAIWSFYVNAYNELTCWWFGPVPGWHCQAIYIGVVLGLAGLRLNSHRTKW